jgi:maleate isomerase
VIAYGSVAGVVAGGQRYHLGAEKRLEQVARESGHAAKVVTSAGALVRGIQALRLRKVSILTPWSRRTTRLVGYLEDWGIEVEDVISLELPVGAPGALDPASLVDHARRLRPSDGIVLSPFVEMPSLAAIPRVESALARPALSATVATLFDVLKHRGEPTYLPAAGALLAVPDATTATSGKVLVDPPALRRTSRWLRRGPLHPLSATQDPAPA